MTGRQWLHERPGRPLRCRGTAHSQRIRRGCSGCWTSLGSAASERREALGARQERRAELKTVLAQPHVRIARPVPPAAPGVWPCLSFPTRAAGQKAAALPLGCPWGFAGGECRGSCSLAAFVLCLRIFLSLKQDPTRLKNTRFALHVEGISRNNGAHKAAVYPPGRLRQSFSGRFAALAHPRGDRGVCP